MASESWELDHIFVWTSVGAPEAACLAELGLAEGTPNEHPGQGSACRRFFFANAYVELLWVCDLVEVRSERSRPTQFYERWSERANGACPFGFCFRPAEPGQSHPPFKSWQYRPTYLPEPLCIEVGTNVGVLSEPWLGYLSFAKRSDRYPLARRQPLEHALGLRELTRAEIASPYDEVISPELKAVLDAKLIQLRPGAEYFVELGFDSEAHNQKRDLRPALPLVFFW